MPHVILEHSNNVEDVINYQDFFKDLIDIMLDLKIISDANTVKSRFIAAKEYYLHQENNIYIHLQLSLLAGRDKVKLQELGKKTKELMENIFTISYQKYKNSFSVEIREIDGEIYQK